MRMQHERDAANDLCARRFQDSLEAPVRNFDKEISCRIHSEIDDFQPPATPCQSRIDARCKKGLVSFTSMSNPTEDRRAVSEVELQDLTARHKLERRLTVQVEVSRIIAESESLAAAAPRLLQVVCEALDCEMGQLWAP